MQSFYFVLLVFSTFFGASLGSFANVVAYRVPLKKSIMYPPSACPNCNKAIRFYDNIPVLSWLLLLGKCRGCKTPISFQYPLVEAISGLFGLGIALQVFPQDVAYIFYENQGYGLFGLFFCRLLFVVACLTLSIIDWKTTELPPEITLPMAALGLVCAFALPDAWPYAMALGKVLFVDALMGAAIGGGLIVLIIAGYYALTKRIGMGGGDIWMMAMVGAFLGWQSLFFIFLAASLQGLVLAGFAVLLGGKQHTASESGIFRNEVLEEVQNEDAPNVELSTGKLALPFGPFIALSAVEYVFLGHWILPIMSNGMLTPWGMVGF